MAGLYYQWKKDALGSTINKMSLKYLLGNCNNFINEESMLQCYGRLMGVTVDRAPKCHCEMAGEGIEYFGRHPKTNIEGFL